MINLVAAEWIKLRSLRSTYWVLGIGALVSIGITVNSARSNVSQIESNGTEPQRLAIDPMHGAFVPEAYQILMVVACSVGAITVFGEYTTGLIRTTFAAVPARRSVIAAKVIVVSAVMLVLGAVVSGASFGLTQAIYHQQHIGLSIADPGAFRAVAGSALLAPVCALVGMALGALIRHAAGSIVGTIVLLLLLPALFTGERYRWVKEIGNAMPVNAWDALTDNPARALRVTEAYPVTVTEAWLVFATWSLAAVAATVVVVAHRDT
jgi:ABC-2 type transport system permease protein